MNVYYPGLAAEGRSIPFKHPLSLLTSLNSLKDKERGHRLGRRARIVG